MPEGDTVYAAAHRLRAALGGKVLTRTDFRIPSLATVDLAGAVIDDVRAVGKHLFIDVTGPNSRTLSIHSHLKMEGVWHVYRPGQRWRRPGHTARVVLEADEGIQAVGFELGILELLTDPDAAVRRLGPDLLGPDWNPQRAAQNLRSDPDRPIGLALLDQRNLAGIGNVYRSELCFLLRVHPATPAGDVDAGKAVELAHRLLTVNRLRTIRVTTGVTARGKELWVYGRDRRPCRRCGTTVVREYLGDDAHGTDASRSIYLCPCCQPSTELR